jgi:hypothetical protein
MIQTLGYLIPSQPDMSVCNQKLCINVVGVVGYKQMCS